MKIECPECFKDNNIVVTGGTVCKHCEKPIDEYRYVRKLMPWFVMLLIGGGGTFAASEYLEANRYSIAQEYSLVEDCTSAYHKIIYRSTFKKKREVCIEALEQTQTEFSFSDAKENTRMFHKTFEKNALDACKKKRGAS